MTKLKGRKLKSVIVGVKCDSVCNGVEVLWDFLKKRNKKPKSLILRLFKGVMWLKVRFVTF